MSVWAGSVLSDDYTRNYCVEAMRVPANKMNVLFTDYRRVQDVGLTLRQLSAFTKTPYENIKNDFLNKMNTMASLEIAEIPIIQKLENPHYVSSQQRHGIHFKNFDNINQLTSTYEQIKQSKKGIINQVSEYVDIYGKTTGRGGEQTYLPPQGVYDSNPQGGFSTGKTGKTGKISEEKM